MYIPNLLYPLICPWLFRLLPCLCCCKQCCREHWGACIVLNHNFLWIYVQEWDCRVIRQFFNTCISAEYLPKYSQGPLCRFWGLFSVQLLLFLHHATPQMSVTLISFNPDPSSFTSANLLYCIRTSLSFALVLNGLLGRKQRAHPITPLFRITALGCLFPLIETLSCICPVLQALFLNGRKIKLVLVSLSWL